MSIRTLVMTLAVSLLSATVMAQPVPGAQGGPGKGLSAAEKEQKCAENPARCARIKEHQEKRAAMRAECQKSPDTCKEKRDAYKKEQKEQHKQMRSEMRAKCDADPKACEARKAEMREKMKARCDAEPKACEAKKAEMRDRMKDRREQRAGVAPAIK